MRKTVSRTLLKLWLISQYVVYMSNKPRKEYVLLGTMLKIIFQTTCKYSSMYCLGYDTSTKLSIYLILYYIYMYVYRWELHRDQSQKSEPLMPNMRENENFSLPNCLTELLNRWVLMYWYIYIEVNCLCKTKTFDLSFLSWLYYFVFVSV